MGSIGGGKRRRSKQKIAKEVNTLKGTSEEDFDGSKEKRAA